MGGRRQQYHSVPRRPGLGSAELGRTSKYASVVPPAVLVTADSHDFNSSGSPACDDASAPPALGQAGRVANGVLSDHYRSAANLFRILFGYLDFTSILRSCPLTAVAFRRAGCRLFKGVGKKFSRTHTGFLGGHRVRGVHVLTDATTSRCAGDSAPDDTFPRSCKRFGGVHGEKSETGVPTRAYGARPNGACTRAHHDRKPRCGGDLRPETGSDSLPRAARPRAVGEEADNAGRDEPVVAHRAPVRP